MLGFLLALGTAISEASKDVASKYNLYYIDEYTAAFSLHFLQSLFLLPIALYFIPQSVSFAYMLALGSSSVLQLIVILLYFKTIKRSEISVTLPLLTLTPLFMLITSPIMIGEFPGLWGVIGILLIIIGTYISNIDTSKRNIFAPFISLIYNQGSRYMLIIASIWSITANIDRVGVNETSPVFWAFSKDALILFYLLPIFLIKSQKGLVQLKSRAKGLLLVGFFKTTSVLTQMFAIQYILVAYVVSIKRASAVFIILYAYLILKEKRNIKNRLWGMTIILIGLFLIAFF